MPLPTLIVFSHLRWSFVFQRPQQLLTRLAGRWNVVFIEEPLPTDGAARLEVRAVAPQLRVVVPHTPLAAPGFHDDQLALLEPLLARELRRRELDDAVFWLYTPMALPLAEALGARVLVYDCMDELSAFKDAPRQLRQRESALLKRAGLVLTGGPSLYEARRGLHPHVHCVPSSVDAAHFSPQSLDPASACAADAAALQGGLPRPRLGYYGVIDERLDAALVARLADARPAWQIVMAGPVVKIDPASLPQRPNLHWLGMQPYARLPYLLNGWDVALMPFALNEATRYISPTKTLEYLAGEVPVVSTAVHDVVSLYGHAVSIAHGHEHFVQCCDAVLAETAAQRCRRALEALTTVATHSWDRSADSVHELVLAARERALAAAEPPTLPGLPLVAPAAAAQAAGLRA